MAIAVRRPYYKRMNARLTPVAYLPLSEAAGAASCLDASGNSRTGAPSNVTFGVTGIGDGLTAASFNGSTSYINWYTTSLRDAFSGSAGAVLIWVKCTALSGDDDELVTLSADSQNRVIIGRTGTNKLFAYYRAGNVTEQFYPLTENTGWMRLGITWSKANERVRMYINGALFGESTTLGTWAGTLSSTQTVIGALSTTPAEGWNGAAAHAMLLNYEPTPAQMWDDAKIGMPTMKRVCVIGDSISAWGASVLGWTEQLRDGYNSGLVSLSNHAVSGQTILTHMSDQVTAGVLDDADLVFIHMGTNDTTATGIQAMVESNLIRLKANNPRATVYYMNVLPRWTDSGGGTPVDKSAIRSAIAAACTAQSVTCWDTYSTPWIAAGDTSDGLHPAQAGMDKIYTEIASRL